MRVGNLDKRKSSDSRAIDAAIRQVGNRYFGDFNDHPQWMLYFQRELPAAAGPQLMTARLRDLAEYVEARGGPDLGEAQSDLARAGGAARLPDLRRAPEERLLGRSPETDLHRTSSHFERYTT